MVQDSGQYSTGQQSSNRATVYEAAEVLGVTVDAVRKRIQRGTIPHERDDDGRVYVLLDETSKLQDTGQDTYRTAHHELVESLQEQVSYLKAIITTRDEDLRRKDHIIAALTERIPELEPASEPRESPTEATEDDGRGEGRGGIGGTPRRPWYRRILGQ